MKDIKLDFNNKTILNEYIDNKDRVKQQVKVVLNIWKKDWFINEDLGVDYLNAFNNESLMLFEVQSAILGISGVSSISSSNIETTSDSSGKRIFTINAEIIVDSEVLNISEVIA